MSVICLDYVNHTLLLVCIILNSDNPRRGAYLKVRVYLLEIITEVGVDTKGAFSKEGGFVNFKNI